MSELRRHGGPLLGFALFALAAGFFVLATIGDPPKAAGGEAIRLLPAASAAAVGPGGRVVVATPMPVLPPSPAASDAGVWATPAEFAPPE